METMEIDSLERNEENNVLDFSLTNDKILLSSAVKLTSWCPTMDLVAIVTVDDIIWIHRFLSWQRLITINCENSVSSIAWSSNGKIISTGSEDGTITLFDVENGQMIFNSRHHEAKIKCLFWVQELEKSSSESDPLQNYANMSSDLLWSLNIGYKSVENTHKTNPLKMSQNLQVLDILVSGDEQGKIILSAFGTFCIGIIDVNSILESDTNISIESLSLSPDLKLLSIVVSNGSCNQLILFDTSHLALRKRELREIASQFNELKVLLEHTKSCLDEIKEKWLNTFKLFTSKISSLEEMLKDEGRPPEVEFELINLLTMGIASPPLRQFLSTNTALNEQNLKRLKKSFEISYAEIRDILNNKFAKAIELVFYRYGQLYSLSKWTEHFEDIGLKEEETQRLQRFAANVIRKTEELSLLITTSNEAYSNFFQWLLKAQNRLSDSSGMSNQGYPKGDELKVVEFLSSSISVDPISEYFKIQKSEDAMSDEILQEKMRMGMSTYPFGEMPPYSLGQLFFNLQRFTEITFAQPATVIGRALKFIQAIPLTTESPLVSFFFSINKEGEIPQITKYLSFSPNQTDKIFVLSYRSEPPFEYKGALILPTDQLVSINFYNDHYLAVLANGMNQDKQYCKLSMYDYKELPTVPFEIGYLGDMNLEQILSKLVDSEPLEPSKSRIFSNVKSVNLSLSGPRGIASITMNNRKLYLFDLEGQDEQESKENDEDENMKEEI